MKELNNFIIEKLRIGKSIQVSELYEYVQNIDEFISKYHLKLYMTNDGNTQYKKRYVYNSAEICNLIDNRNKIDYNSYEKQITEIFTKHLQINECVWLLDQKGSFYIFIGNTQTENYVAWSCFFLENGQIEFRYPKNNVKYADIISTITDYIITDINEKH